MYNKFTNDTITEIEQVCLSMLSIADKKKGKWTARTKEKYTGLMKWLKDKESLSSKQCMIIVDGCKLNNLVCPQAVLDKAGVTSLVPSNKKRPTTNNRAKDIQANIKSAKSSTLEFSKEHLDLLCTTIALQLSDKLFDTLNS